MAPTVAANLFLHGTQENGDQHLENFCHENEFNLTTVDEVELKLGTDVTFKKIKRAQDSTKWAVSERDYWVCFGSVEKKV